MRYGAVAVAAASALVLAACGSSGGKVSSSSPTSTTSPSMSSGEGKPIVMTADSKLGRLLVDSKGMTLYTLMNDGKPVACTGACLTIWPPLVLQAGETSAVASGVASLGTTNTGAGKQVSYKGAPLHTFSADQAPGDTNGEGITSFGGTWHVVQLMATTATTSPAAGAVPATTPTTTSSGGYGY
jgi:predicted lipoprotein with Yx(FWY)xxD motif